jgi:hypothetical protein
MHPRRSGINARGLTPNFIDRSEAIKQQLPYYDRLGIGAMPIGVSRSCGRIFIVPPVPAGARFKPHLRQQRGLILPEFRFSGAPIGGGFPDGRVALDGLNNGVVNRKRLSGSGCSHNASE